MGRVGKTALVVVSLVEASGGPAAETTAPTVETMTAATTAAVERAGCEGALSRGRTHTLFRAPPLLHAVAFGTSFLSSLVGPSLSCSSSQQQYSVHFPSSTKL